MGKKIAKKYSREGVTISYNPLKSSPSYDCSNNKEKNIRYNKAPARAN